MENTIDPQLSSEKINALTGKEMPLRDANWEQEFLEHLPNIKFKLLNEQPQVGPDGWPYMMVEISEDGTEPCVNLIHWLGERGIGLAINPNKEYPDYVLTYGMVWNYLQRGQFVTPVTQEELNTEFDLKEGQELWIGQPTEEYFPGYARKVFKNFLANQNVLAPKMLMVSADQKNYDLALSLESLGNPPQKEWQGILEAFSWFMPAHYRLSLMSETSVEGFSAI